MHTVCDEHKSIKTKKITLTLNSGVLVLMSIYMQMEIKARWIRIKFKQHIRRHSRNPLGCCPAGAILCQNCKMLQPSSGYVH